eukprot:TRINITY_DN23514_c0_g1_i1.p1 TRINITY_DN23514_c0_g1~~TRINITY_DN23514_c0_g1_i1.p1  ORF type:complete len:137 (-),score=6.63 TRINITY_DN23514_c0_g1_i1:134-544(-)
MLSSASLCVKTTCTAGAMSEMLILDIVVLCCIAKQPIFLMPGTASPSPPFPCHSINEHPKRRKYCSCKTCLRQASSGRCWSSGATMVLSSPHLARRGDAKKLAEVGIIQARIRHNKDSDKSSELLLGCPFVNPFRM